MPVLALVLYGVLALAAVAQVAVQTRIVGSSRFRLFGDRRGSAEWWSGWLIAAAFACAGLAPVLDLAAVVHPYALLDREPLYVAGLAIWLLGAGLARWTQFAMGRSWRIGVDPGERLDLVTAGPFRVIRHPIYTGLLMMLTGFALLTANAVAWAGALLGYAGFELLTRCVEEPHLRRVHAGRYQEYCQRTGRFLPRLGRGR